MNREKELTVSRQVALDAGALLKGFLGRVSDFEGNPLHAFSQDPPGQQLPRS
jgi:hypothetical protein